MTTSKDTKTTPFTPYEVAFKLEVDRTVVEILEDLLAKAMTGEIEGLAVVSTYKRGTIDYHYSKMISRNDVIGGMERLKFHLLQGMYDE